MKDLSERERGVLIDALDDRVGLWMLVRDVRDRDPGSSDDEVRDAVIAAVTTLLKSGYVRLGNPDREGRFHEWNLTPEDAATRIDHEWRALGGDPTLGDICWLNITERGREATETVH